MNVGLWVPNCCASLFWHPRCWRMNRYLEALQKDWGSWCNDLHWFLVLPYCPWVHWINFGCENAVLSQQLVLLVKLPFLMGLVWWRPTESAIDETEHSWIKPIKDNYLVNQQDIGSRSINNSKQIQHSFASRDLTMEQWIELIILTWLMVGGCGDVFPTNVFPLFYGRYPQTKPWFSTACLHFGIPCSGYALYKILYSIICIILWPHIYIYIYTQYFKV